MTEKPRSTTGDLFAQIAAGLDAALAGLDAHAEGLQAVQAAFERLAEEEEASPPITNGADGLLTTEQKAKELNIAPQTLRRWRSEGKGPPAYKLGSNVRYPKGLLPPD